MTNKKYLTNIFLTLLSLNLLVACSDSTDINSAGGGRGGTQNGFLSLGITDAPIDDAAEVWVQFDGVVLKPFSALSPITLSFPTPMNINLLALQGQNSMQMLVDETLPADSYEWLRLNVTAADDGVQDSYIKLKDNSVHELNIPSGSESGLKIVGGLEVIANTPTSMTIDFDLRKSITLTGSGKYELSPVLKLVNNAETSSLVGTVEPLAITDPGCSDADPSTGNAIYLYDGFNVVPDDIDNTDPDPVASALVTLNNTTGAYEYSFGFIPFGDYTAAFTCQADLEDPANDDIITFSGAQNVTLTSTTLPVNISR